MLQFGSMDLHLRCDEAFLRLRQAAAKALDCVEGEDGRVLLIVRMEMRPMVRFRGFDVHPDNDPEEAREFPTGSKLARA